MLEIVYRDSDGSLTRRGIEPHRLILLPNSRAWYLQAFCRLRADWRDFRIDRIAELRSMSESFVRRGVPTRELRAEPDRRLFVELATRLSDAPGLREEQHWSFTSEEAHGEEVVMGYRVRDYSEIVPWVLSKAGLLLRVGPEDFRQVVSKKIEEIRGLLT